MTPLLPPLYRPRQTRQQQTNMPTRENTLRDQNGDPVLSSAQRDAVAQAIIAAARKRDGRAELDAPTDPVAAQIVAAGRKRRGG
jgi:hypothetical protein